MTADDRDHLDRIERKVDITLSEVRQIQSYDGPIGQMMQKMASNEQRVKSAHIRLDDHEVHIEKIRGTLWSIVWKIIALGAAGGSTAFAAVSIASKLSGG